jgi:hypothetical protein
LTLGPSTWASPNEQDGPDFDPARSERRLTRPRALTPRRYLAPPRFLMRPLLIGGTLAGLCTEEIRVAEHIALLGDSIFDNARTPKVCPMS